MELYFRPFACSLASRICLNELGLDAGFKMVGKAQVLPNGDDYLSLNPLGYVPALGVGEDAVLTENTAILQYIADQKPQGGLLPAVGTSDRYRVLQWLGFVATELHSKTFAMLFNSALADDAKAVVREKAASRFAHLSHHLEGRDFLAGGFSIADAYLVTVLNWVEFAGLDLTAWPVLKAYRDRLRQRPSVAKAMAVEQPLLQAA
jgi:glutathione S-transferase